LKTFSAGSLAPKKTLYTIQRLKGPVSAAAVETPPQPASRPSSEEMLNKVEATENRMSDTLDELGQRLSPQQIKARVIQGIQKNPYRSGLLAMGMGLLSGLFLAREFRRS
jgi:hypothetical protein